MVSCRSAASPATSRGSCSSSSPTILGADGADGTRFEALVPHVDAIVFTDDFADGFHYSSTAVERISKTLAPLKLRIPSAIFGGPALAEDWSSLSGAPVLAQVDPKSEDATSILKALVKALLRSNIRSTPPPPVA